MQSKTTFDKIVINRGFIYGKIMRSREKIDETFRASIFKGVIDPDFEAG